MDSCPKKIYIVLRQEYPLSAFWRRENVMEYIEKMNSQATQDARLTWFHILIEDEPPLESEDSSD